VTFERRLVTSLEELQRERGYDTIVVATGAAASVIREVPQSVKDLLDLSKVLNAHGLHCLQCGITCSDLKSVQERASVYFLQLCTRPDNI
jgi:hypothetical protein